MYKYKYISINKWQGCKPEYALSARSKVCEKHRGLKTLDLGRCLKSEHKSFYSQSFSYPTIERTHI